MNIKNNVISLSEYEPVYYDLLKTTFLNYYNNKADVKHEIKSIKNQIAIINKKLGTEVIKLLWNKLEATNYVGFIKLKHFTIQIIPKIYNSDDSKNLRFLTFILEYLDKQIISFKNLDVGELSSIQGNLFEYYIYIFVKNLRDFFKVEVLRTYVRVNQNSPKFKGKLSINQNLRKNQNKIWQFFCQYDIFSIDNIFNQIIKYVLTLLKIQTRLLKTKRYIGELLNYLDEVSYKCICSQDFEKIKYDRLNIKYKPYIDFCKLIIRQSTVIFNTSNLKLFYFLFDMNRLFEAFLSKFIKNNISKLKINKKNSILNAENQQELGKLFDKFKLICDLVIEYKDISEKRIILDFKYKILNSEKKTLGLSQSDFYQMFAYSQSPLQKTENLILLYPKSELEEINFNEKYPHQTKPEENITIFIKSIDLQNIFNKIDKYERENVLINALNEIFVIN